ncbi:MAG: hypothetical protein AB1798_10420 [Spirochaetota bacterium]
MGWRGTLRTIGAISRSIERDSRRRQREYAARQKQIRRLEELQQAEAKVEEYNNYVDLITSMHKECSEAIDWVKIRDLPEPQEPKRSDRNESQARKALDRYRPGFLDRLLRREARKRQALSQAVHDGRLQDDKEYRAIRAEYIDKRKEWKYMHDVAIGILKGDVSAYLSAVREMDPFEEISNIGSAVSLSVLTPKTVAVALNVNTSKVIPKESKSLLKSGKLSVKEMPASRYWQLYQDHVCSGVLRVAREVFALLPVDKVAVDALCKMVNPKTGHLDDTVILSVLIPRATLAELDMDRLDPSDSMSNFLFRMKFKKITGFEPVEPIDVSTVAET